MGDMEILAEQLRRTEDRVLILEEERKHIGAALERIFAKLNEIGEGRTTACVQHGYRIDQCEKRLASLEESAKRPWITLQSALITAVISAVVGGGVGLVIAHFPK